MKYISNITRNRIGTLPDLLAPSPTAKYSHNLPCWTLIYIQYYLIIYVYTKEYSE